jgi:ligand-binding SRPBCC domain-containing protein
MTEYTFNDNVWLPRPIEEIFTYFSAARNLEELTPPWLKFQVMTPDPIVMDTGTLIDYKITIHGFPIRWQTQIVEWAPPHRFIDVQLSGPYKLWHHTHTFTAQRGGTLCRDDVRYYPKGGALANTLFVSKDVKRIFDFRKQKLQELFGRES